jgi:hypothetical protein
MSIITKTAAALALLALAASPALAETARGEGTTLDQAVRQALRRAVEQSVGVHVQAVTAVDRFEVVRNEIVSHAEGYVSRYTLVRQGTTESGAIFAEIDAEVDAGRVHDNADAIPTLLAMVGHPRVAVLGVDGGFDAASAIVPEAVALRDAAGDILRDRFRFTAIDAKSLPRKGSAAKRQDALAAARSAKADYAVLVTLSGRDLAMEAVKLSDGTVVGRDSAAGDAASYFAIRDKVFPLTVSLASQIAGDLQHGATGGVRYSVLLTEFPTDVLSAIERALPNLPGYMRMETQARNARSVELSLWSQQGGDDFAAALGKLMSESNSKTRLRVQGQSFHLDFIDPVFR